MGEGNLRLAASAATAPPPRLIQAQPQMAQTDQLGQQLQYLKDKRKNSSVVDHEGNSDEGYNELNVVEHSSSSGSEEDILTRVRSLSNSITERA